MSNYVASWGKRVPVLWREPSPKNTLILFFGMLALLQLMALLCDVLAIGSVLTRLYDWLPGLASLIEMHAAVGSVFAQHFSFIALLTGLVGLFDFYNRAKDNTLSAPPGFVAYSSLVVALYLFFEFLFFRELIGQAPMSMLRQAFLYSAIAVLSVSVLLTMDYLIERALAVTAIPLNILIFGAGNCILANTLDFPLTRLVTYVASILLSLGIYCKIQLDLARNTAS